MPKFDFCPDLGERSSLIGSVKQSELVCCHCALVFVTVTGLVCLEFGFSWAEPRWPAGPSRISSGDRSAVIRLHTQKLDWHFLLHSWILHAKSLSAPSELGGWAAGERTGVHVWKASWIGSITWQLDVRLVTFVWGAVLSALRLTQAISWKINHEICSAEFQSKHISAEKRRTWQRVSMYKYYWFYILETVPGDLSVAGYRNSIVSWHILSSI